MHCWVMTVLCRDNDTSFCEWPFKKEKRKKNTRLVYLLPTVKSAVLFGRQTPKSFPHVSGWRVWCRRGVMKSVWMETRWLRGGNWCLLSGSPQREERCCLLCLLLPRLVILITAATVWEDHPPHACRGLRPTEAALPVRSASSRGKFMSVCFCHQFIRLRKKEICSRL